MAARLQMTWQPLQKRKGGPLGLRNLGNTCYLNSVLQCLTYTPPLANFCLLSHHSSSCNSINGSANLACPFCILERRIFRSLTIDLVADSPTRIHSCLSLFAKHFRNGCQEDAHEFLRYVIDACNNVCVKLHKMLSIAKSKTRQSDFRGSKEDPYTVVKEIFGGVLQSQVKCLCCGSESNKQDEIMDLSLDVIQIGSLKEAMRRYFQAEVLDGNNKYRCEKCKKLSAARKQLSIFEAPNVLVIQLKRFENIHGGKIDRFISFEERLELVGHMCRSSQDPRPEYILYAVIVHAGYSQESGHYYSYVKDATGKWFCCNDAHVTGVNSQSVLNEKAYVLFYVRSNVRSKVKDQVLSENGHVIRPFVDEAQQPSVKGNDFVKSDTAAKLCSDDKVQDVQPVKFKLVKAGPPCKNQRLEVHDNGRAVRCTTNCRPSTEAGLANHDSHATPLMSNGNLKNLESPAVLRHDDVASQKQDHVHMKPVHSSIKQCAVDTIYSASGERDESKPLYMGINCHAPEVPPSKGVHNTIVNSENNCSHRERNPFMEKTNCRELHSNGHSGYLRYGESANSPRGPVQYRQQGSFRFSESAGESLGAFHCSKNQRELRPDSVNGSHAGIKRKALDGCVFLDSLGRESVLTEGYMVADLHSNELPCQHIPVDFELENLKHRLATDTRAWLHRSGWCDTVRDSFRVVKRNRLFQGSWSKDLMNEKSRYRSFQPRFPYNGKFSGGRVRFTHRRTPLCRRFLCGSWMNGNQPVSPVSNELTVWANSSHGYARFVS